MSWSQHGLLQGAHVHETSVRVAFGAPCIGPTCSAASACLKIFYVPPYFRRAGARNLGERSVWRAPPFRSTLPLGDQSCLLGRLSRPRIPECHRFIRNHVAKVAPERLEPPKASPRIRSDLPVGIFRRRLRHAYVVAQRNRAG